MDRLAGAYGINDLNPQAILSVPVSYLAEKFQFKLEEDEDGLDRFEGAALFVAGRPIVLKHYAGHPPRTTTVYLSASTKDVVEITKFILVVLKHLELSRDSLQWERKMNPEY